MKTAAFTPSPWPQFVCALILIFAAELILRLVAPQIGLAGPPWFLVLLAAACLGLLVSPFLWWWLVAQEKLPGKAEEARRGHEEQLAALIHSVDGIVWEADAATFRFTFVSPRAERLLGYPTARWTDEPAFWVDHIHPDDREHASEYCRQCTREKRDHEFEYRMLAAGGRTVWLRDLVTVVVKNDRPVKLCGIMVDITAHKAAEAQIREQADLLNKTYEAIMVIGLDNRYTFWNVGAELLTGWPATEVLGRTAEELFGLADIASIAAARRTVTATGAWHGELSLRHRDGRLLVLDLRINLVRDAAGQPKAHLSIGTDITEKKQMAEQLLRVQRLESLGMLASGIAHDLNNILSPVLMAAPLLRTRATHPFDLRVLDLVEKSAQRGGALVQQILSYARGVEGDKTRVQPAHLLHDIGALIRDTFPKTIRLESEVATDLRTVLVNPTQLHQILLNLCINARDAMPGGGTLTLRARNAFGADAPAALPPGDYLVFEVADTGTGMTPEVLARIWEPFFTTKGDDRGTGLGLATVRGIVTNLRGGIEVDSAPGYGSTFRIWLPVAKDASTNPFNARPDSLFLPPAQGELVLVVDDEAAVRELITQVLTAAGYRILSAKDGGEMFLLHLAQLHEVSLILMDIGLPDQDGLSLARILQRTRPDQRILFITGYTDSQGAASRALPTGLPLLKKPFTGAELLGAVQRALVAPGISVAELGSVPQRSPSPTRATGKERPTS